MIDVQVREWHLTTPLKDEDVQRLRAGDMVYLTGLVFTARDGVYRYMLDEGHEPPVDLRGMTNVSFQSSPAGVEVEPGHFEVSSLQATAGFRYARWARALIEGFGVKAIVGKAGMNSDVYRDVFEPNGAVFLSTVGYGIGAIYGHAIKEVPSVHWVSELGISEALWILRLEDLGPLLVEGDAHGGSFFDGVNREINENLDHLYEGLKQPIFRRLGEEQNRSRELF